MSGPGRRRGPRRPRRTRRRSGSTRRPRRPPRGTAAGTRRRAEVGLAELRDHAIGLGLRAVVVLQRDDAGDRLAEVEPRDPLLLRLVEQEARGGPGDRVDAEVVGPCPAAVVRVPVLRHVVGDRGGRGPEVAVDRRLGVRVHVVEQREALRQRVRVRRDLLAEQLELGIAVAARVRAEDLVVGAVLAHDVEDVLELAVLGRRPERRVGRRVLRVGRADLAGRARGEPAQAPVGRELQDAARPKV